MKIRHALTATGLAVATGVAVLVAAPVATADTPLRASAAAPGTDWYANLGCDELGAAHAAVQRWTEIIAGEADIPGSTAWVTDALAQAQTNGNSRRVDRLQKVLAARAAHPDRWPHLLTGIEHLEQRENC